MLHIILGILKVIAIILGILVGLVLLLLLSLLLVPLRYQGKLQKDGNGVAGRGKITWLAHGLSVLILYEHGEFRIKLRILGIPAERVKGLVTRLGKIRFRRKKTQPDTKKQLKTASSEGMELPYNTLEEPNQEVKESLQGGRSVQEALEEKDIPAKEGKKNKFTALLAKLKGILYKLLHLPGKILAAVRNIYSTTGEIYGRMKVFLELIKSEEFLGARTLLWEQLRTLLRRLGPTKIKGTLSYGFDDPALTGQVLAGLSLFYPKYGDRLRIYPYFDRKILETDLYLRGRIYGVHLLAAAWKLYRDSNIKYMIKRCKHKEE